MILFLLGLAGGVLAGLLGIGGGVIFIAVLPYFLLQEGILPADLPEYTVANSLFGTFFSGLASVISLQVSQKERGLPYGRALITGLTAAVFALLSFWLIVRQPWYSRSAFSLVVVILLGLLLARSLYSLYHKGPIAHNRPKAKPVFLSSVGAFSGTVSSLSGMGGGVIVVPALRFMGKYPVSLANFISSFTIATASLATIVYSVMQTSSSPWGFLVPAVSGPLAVGVLMGAPIGVKLVPRLSQKVITILYCVFVGAVLVRYLYSLANG